MSEIYEKAATRHWSDGLHLELALRLANADHLYGFAAECALKVALVAVTGSPIPDTYKHHINILWTRMSVQSIQRRFPTMAALLKVSNPFRDWSVNQRYHDGSAITAEAIARHKMYARRLLGCVGITTARLEG